MNSITGAGLIIMNSRYITPEQLKISSFIYIPQMMFCSMMIFCAALDQFICTFEDDTCPFYDSSASKENWIKVDGSSSSKKDNTLNHGWQRKLCSISHITNSVSRKYS